MYKKISDLELVTMEPHKFLDDFTLSQILLQNTWVLEMQVLVFYKKKRKNYTVVKLPSYEQLSFTLEPYIL